MNHGEQTAIIRYPYRIDQLDIRVVCVLNARIYTINISSSRIRLVFVCPTRLVHYR